MRKFRFSRVILLISFMFQLAGHANAQCTYMNPLMEGADPHASFHEGKYYLLVTRGDRITIKSSPKLEKIGPLNEIRAWEFRNTPVGGHIWAPELHRIDEQWYIYSCGQNTGLDNNQEARAYIQEDQEMFVLKSTTGDPFGPYEFVSWLMPGMGAIDETIFTHTDGKHYIIWSQFNIPGQPQSQCLYIAELLSPTSIGVKRVLISCPDQPWELNGWPVNEGAAVLQKNGKTFIVYSGSGYLTPEYALGYLVNTDGDLLNPGSWTKVGPVFQQDPEAGVYSTGHNSFTTSPDGTEDWIVFHARLSPDGNTPRYTFIQKFKWEHDIPVFGTPKAAGELLSCPSDTGWIL
ncbi:MAG: glycoside hydrolase family 43 protein [Bacteroidales bacterium]|nr:glycoside hydrolase family 43 protein [Bacteroidales bacterium]